ncbi:hypothetical protein GDO86_016534 [Hymenochirus boettgeri]|uniref:Uncharacterized protein n=1 Tax=Hymenochirus boettgeri TaxID=247094 RepID=A0A8T2JXC5_9PIPI|nr:hypothetical protein GDO86_016534 [Hymenochirus boettgeri]
MTIFKKKKIYFSRTCFYLYKYLFPIFNIIIFFVLIRAVDSYIVNIFYFIYIFALSRVVIIFILLFFFVLFFFPLVLSKGVAKNCTTQKKKLKCCSF